MLWITWSIASISAERNSRVKEETEWFPTRSLKLLRLVFTAAVASVFSAVAVHVPSLEVPVLVLGGLVLANDV